MDIGVKETVCTSCSHRKVCKLKHETLAAQEAVDKAVAHIGHTRDGEALKRVVDMDWLRPVMVDCIHFEPYDIRLKGENCDDLQRTIGY